MPYATGTVYKIICNVDSRFVYIGSTFNEVRHRFQQHKANYRQWIAGKNNIKCSCFDHFKKYGLENFTIVRIKEYVCWCENKKDKKHLSVYEQLWINKTRNCCNITPAFQPIKKRLKQKKHQEYYYVHKEHLQKQSRAYYRNNKLEIYEKHKKHKTCEKCGSTVRKADIARHLKTKKCMSFSN